MGAQFCDRCVGRLKPIDQPSCVVCGRSLTGVAAAMAPPGNVRCADCRREPPPFAAVRSAAVYEEPLRTAIHRFKYRGQRNAARALAQLLMVPATSLRVVWSAAADGSPPVVVPVPLHPRRQRERGYNQAALLAAPLAAALRWPFDDGALRRIRDTGPLVRLSQQQRRDAVRGAFAANRRLDGMHVLLVDDVATTCSTLASAASACLAAGAASVAAVTLARDRRRV